jgi:nitrogenase molybdenum-iron protein NifN
MPMLHGSQGCATYIRRYLISHFRETVDIASSNFSEETTIFGGNRNFNTGIDNIISQYHPKAIAIASACLSETIGEDVQRLIYEYKTINGGRSDLPEMLFASTPSYQGTHYEGFHEAVLAAVKALARGEGKAGKHINLFCNFISPEDIRRLKEIVADFGVSAMIFPDYSDTLDGASWDSYRRIPEGGTTLNAVRQSAGEYLRNTFGVVRKAAGLPTGILETDKLFELLSAISGKPVPEKYVRQRGRLVDLYIDGHKYVSGKKVVIYGEEDLVVALAAFASEIGMKPLLCATGGESGRLADTLKAALGKMHFDEMIVGQGVSFEQIEALIDSRNLKPDLMMGNSKGYYIARRLGVPLVRVGFPIHDRIGAQHKHIVAYSGTTALFEETVNALMEHRQRKSPVGYQYM